ncbi:MAG: TipAS antibiotic-recognition domain-containing protein [Streptococcaceae bacterium]|jgi:DNA-binding transcriptional MerR regulator|nr:TipAS antibiotic-recognition domain-containing protein [Streptococcaceae bacterium]
MNIKEVTKLTGLTSRALRVWEDAGLLSPERGENSYREYGETDLTRIFYIMSLRALDLSLPLIREILEQSKDEKSALAEHLNRLKNERERLSTLISSLTEKLEKGDYQMSEKDFELLKKQKIAENEEKYGKEVREKYGEEQVSASNAKFSKMTPEEMKWAEETHKKIVDLLNEAFPIKDSVKAREAVRLHREWLSYYWPQPVTAEAHQGLAQMYVDDPRFRKNYDRDFEGVAEFFRDEIMSYYLL